MGKSLNTKLIKSFPRQPYLSWTEDPTTTITIRYGSHRKEPDAIYYGVDKNLNSYLITNYNTEKDITLKGLKPDTKYYYRIGQSGSMYSFHTAPEESVPFHFTVYGNYTHKGDKEVKMRLYNNILKEHPAFIIFTGDMVSAGNFPVSWKREFFSTIRNISPHIPIMAAHGNHDGSGSQFRYYFQYPGNLSWYSFVYSNAIFIALDTQASFSPGSLQYSFLIKTLQQSKEDWKFIYFHKPPYSTNTGHRNNYKVRNILSPIFDKYGVDIVFCGHNHGYERTHPIIQNQVDPENGVIYITTGGGGGQLSPFISRNKLTRFERQYTSVRVKLYHYLLVNIDRNRLLITAKNQKGQIIDRYEKSRHGEADTGTVLLPAASKFDI